jgi:hypothetical protein
MRYWNALIPTAKTALVYFTTGCMGLVWSGIWYLYLVNNPPESPGLFYVVGGFAMTSLVLVGIGLAYGYVFPMPRTTDIQLAPSPAALVPVMPVAPAAQLAPPVPANLTVNIVPAPGDAAPVPSGAGSA